MPTPGQRQHGGQPENTRHPDPDIDNRTQDKRQRKCRADTHADHRHHLDPVVLLGEIRRQRHDRRRDGAAALYRTADDHAPDSVGLGRHHAAQREYQQPANDHRLAPDMVGQHAERDLQQRLGEAVGTDGQTHQHRCDTNQLFRIEREYRENQKQAQHAQREDAGQGDGRTTLDRCHPPRIYLFLIHCHLV